MKKIISAILFIILLLPPLISSAEAYSFQADLAAVEKTIQSVLMLEVYDKRGGLFATGSGFVAFNNGTLVTNYHVMEGAASITAVSDGGVRYEVDRVLAADKELDIAILAFKEPTAMAPLVLADNAVLKRGEPVVTIGSPQGIRNTVAYGNISAFVRWNRYTEIQYTAPISHGSSGGVLLNNAGQVIGVVYAYLEGGQNLNYAIDIDYVTGLYRGITPGSSVLLADYDPVSGDLSASQVPVVGTNQGAAISGLTVVQTDANTVRLSWSERAAGTFTYHIIYEINGNAYYTYDSTNETTYTAVGLVPGSAYTFYVSTKGADRDSAELRESLTVAGHGDYTLRGFSLNAFEIYSCSAGADFASAAITAAEVIPLADTSGQSRLLDHYAVLSCRMEASPDATNGIALYALFTPSGSVYTQRYRYEYPAGPSDVFVRYLNINDFFSDIAEFEGAVPVGAYTLALFYDGLSVGRVAFTVTGGGNTQPTAALTVGPTATPTAAPTATPTAAPTVAPTSVPIATPESRELLPPAGISAFAEGAAIQLYWNEAAGAEKYNLYRSQTLNGIYAALGTSVSGHYTDLAVIPGRTYYYRIESVSGTRLSKRSEPVKATLPAAAAQSTPTSLPQPSATPDPAAGYFLTVGEDAYVGTADDPYINPKIKNISGSRTVDSFTLSYYCTDAGGEPLFFNNTDGYYSEYTYNAVIGPNGSVYPGKVSMSLYGSSVRYIYLAISGFHMADGETITVAEPAYYYWELN